MEKFTRAFFSMRMMALGLMVFFVAIGWATMLESMYDIQTAKLMVYNAFWFELLLAYLGVSLISNIFTYRMYQREKIAMLMFHLSFIVMLIGAAFTRYVSFEGMMMIREGATSDFIFSSDPYVWISATDGTSEPVTYTKKTFMSEQTNNYFSTSLENVGKDKKNIEVEYVNFQKKMVDSLVVNDSIQGVALEIVTGGMNSNYVTEGGFIMIGDKALSFDKKDAMPGIEVVRQGAKMLFKTIEPIRCLPMSEMQKAMQSGGDVADSLYKQIPIDTLVPFETTTLYQIGSEQFVFKQVIKNAKRMPISSGRKDVGTDYLTLKITDGDQSKIVQLKGGYGQIPEREMFVFNGLTYQMEYGSIKLQVPFSIACKDFQLDKYPGSESPSSFASEVTILDEKNGVKRDRRIFMNNVMDYQGYRFFQSGYDPDEGGTRLSVNHDWWGTNISYLGYLMMGIGMILSMFAPNGRFRVLLRKLSKSLSNGAGVAMLFVLASSMSLAQDGHEGHDHAAQTEAASTTTNPMLENPVHRVMSEAHSEEVASLLVQFQGRILPMHSLCDQLLRKVARDNKHEDYNAVQTMVSMHMYPDYWATQDVIYVSGKSNLREKLKMDGSHTSYADLTNPINGEFILLPEYQKAHQTLESKRGEFEKRLIQLAERYQVMRMIFSWDYMHIIPLEGDKGNMWYIPLSMELVEKDSIASGYALRYFTGLNAAAKDNKYGAASDLLNELKDFQRSAAADIVPSESKVNMEISYNKMNIFKNSLYMYFSLGFLLLLIFFVKVLVKPGDKTEKIFKYIARPFIWIALIVFLYHGYGLYMRWIISGHAPWSNGYEAVVFIAWGTALTGFIFSRKHVAIMAGALILASMMIYVTEMNLMDPEITQLQPVLKSYWLMIHVAIITTSYGPLGLAWILGILNLILSMVRTKKNGARLNRNINQLTYVSEMVMIIGVFMLTIGTFLGGIWANESWGRYWGWDPKETWALVSVLVYAMILHFRFIPGLKSKFVFNFVSAWAYASILFTFFGVNFYLTGLHSYAQGESLGVFPGWLKVMIGCFAIFTFGAALLNWRYNKHIKPNLLDE